MSKPDLLHLREFASSQPTRRMVVAGLLVAPAGCAPTLGSLGVSGDYAAITNEPFQIPALPGDRNPDLFRREVAYSGPYKPGTIVIRIPERRLYLVLPGGRAMRYAVGVGRAEALNFRGSAVIGRKAEWPSWTPTEHMMQATPRYVAYAGGMPGGINNPLGARALYLYRDGQDSHFRLHGTTEPQTIGTAVSSGCIRLVNHDIIDLYKRVPVGANVVVLQS